MTESEIMKALYYMYCATAYKDTITIKKETAIGIYDFVNRKNAECKECGSRTSESIEKLQKQIAEKNAEIERLEKSKRLADDLIEQMRITINNRTTENQKLKLDNEELKIINKNLDKLFLKARAEAIKEFAERVKTEFRDGWEHIECACAEIDQIAKEMGVEL